MQGYFYSLIKLKKFFFDVCDVYNLSFEKVTKNLIR